MSLSVGPQVFSKFSTRLQIHCIDIILYKATNKAHVLRRKVEEIVNKFGFLVHFSIVFPTATWF